jgi:hypothetical protein
MKRKFYRIAYKVVELGNVYIGGRVVSEPIQDYMKFFRRTYPDASSVYVELMEEFEDDDDESATATESVIIMG